MISDKLGKIKEIIITDEDFQNLKLTFKKVSLSKERAPPFNCQCDNGVTRARCMALTYSRAGHQVFL